MICKYGLPIIPSSWNELNTQRNGFYRCDETPRPRQRLERKTFSWVAYSSGVQPIIIMVGRGSVQADVALERELRVLYLAQVMGSELRYWT